MSDSIVISISPKNPKGNARRKEVQGLLAHAARKNVSCEGVSALYRLEGRPDSGQIERIAREILCDPVVEESAVDDRPEKTCFFVDVWPKPGVSDPVGETVLKAIGDLGIKTVAKVTSGTRYAFSGNKAALNGKTGVFAFEFASRELLNPLIQECKILQAL